MLVWRHDAHCGLANGTAFGRTSAVSPKRVKVRTPSCSRHAILRRRAPRSRWPVLIPAVILGAVLLPTTAIAGESDAFSRALARGPLLGSLAAFVGGLLTAATPCVYPMIAITVSIFGAREATSRKQAALLSTSFVLGIVALFTPLLVGAALTGTIFGSWLASPWVNVGMAALLAALAASMFGAFEMVLPSSVMQRLTTVGGIGYGGAFLLGLVSAIVAAPCTGPVLGAVLVWIGQSRNVLLGSVVGASFALGLGLPFWLVGTFAMSLPKGGKWMLGVKSLFGTVMLVVALHFLKNAFPALKTWARPDAAFIGMAVVPILVGVAMGAIHLAWNDGGLAVKARKGLGIGLTVTGGFLAWTAIDLPRGSLTWERSEVQAVAKAKTERRPMMIDFTADWCAACQEIARETFADPRVRNRALTGNFVTLQIDASRVDSPEVDEIMGKYKVVGLPTVVIMDSNGVERRRFREFVGPDSFLAALEGVK